MPMFRSTHRHFKPEPFWRDLIERWKASGQSVAAFWSPFGQPAFLTFMV